MQKELRMRNLGRLMLAGAGALTVLAGTSLASASAQPASKLTGYTYKEASVNVPANAQAEATAKCPKGDNVVGGGGYQVTQNTEEDLNSSAPDGHRKWTVQFNNQASSSDTGVAVAICVAASSLADYSIQTGATVDVSPNSSVEATVSCPSGTVALGGGWVNEGTAVSDSNGASDPLGSNGWRAYPAAGPSASDGYAVTPCAAQPSKWAQVSSSYVVNPVSTATPVSVTCPKGTKVLGGGDFNDSGSSLVNIGLTSSLSSLKGWSTTENNDSSSSESVDAWAVCAKV
jgi:hypothetical protein